MDSIPFRFVTEVVAHLGDLRDVQKLGRVWNAAAREEAGSRNTCSLMLSLCRRERVIYYAFMCDPGGMMSFEEVKKLNLRRLRVICIILSKLCNYEIEEELLPELLSLANRYLTYRQRFTIRSHLDVDGLCHDLSMVQSLYSLRNVREIVLWYDALPPCGRLELLLITTSHEFLRQLLSSARTEVLRLRYGWPLNTLYILMEAWAKSSIRDIYIDEASKSMAHTLPCDLLKKIHQLWVDGFFVTRRLDAVFLIQHDLSALDTVLGPSTGDVSSKKWCFRHPSHRTFQIFTYSELFYTKMRILIA
uniref:F-box domain-containing protein n=1 Tax=Steinernema glaseri TaxID=37863 RepID=A0A1I7Y7L9_9BILA